MKNLFTSLVLLGLANTTNAQAYQTNWANEIASNSGTSQSLDILVDGSGNLYDLGTFNGTTNFDPTRSDESATAVGQSDIYLRKLDANGNLLWVETYGSTGHDTPTKMATDANGNIVVVGSFVNTINFTNSASVNSITSNGNNDAFAMKVDENGTVLWANTYGGSENDFAFDVAIDEDGNVAVAGSFSGDVDFDNSAASATLSSGGQEQGFVAMTDENGRHAWASMNKSDGMSRNSSMAISADGSVVLSGYYTGKIDLDPSEDNAFFNSNGAHDIFVQKLDNTGKLVWAHSYGGSEDDVYSYIDLDNNGSVIVAGEFRGTVAFKTATAQSFGNGDIFVLKLDASGSELFAKTVGGPEEDFASNVKVDESDNVYVTGYFRATVNFNTSGNDRDEKASAGGMDGFVLKLDNNGNYNWVESFGADLTDMATGLEIISENEIAISGTYSNEVDMDPSANDLLIRTPNTSGQGFVAMINTCANVTVKEISACDSYTWNVNGTTYEASSNAQVLMENINGCDSLVRLELTINYSNIATDMIEACAPITWIDGMTYDADNNTAEFMMTNQFGCDSLVKLDLVFNTPSTDVTQAAEVLTAAQDNATYQWVDCDNNNAPIAGAVGQVFTATENGTYAVIINNKGCEEMSACFTVTGLGLNDLSNKAFTVSPNPTNGKITIASPITEAISVNIYTLAGQLKQSMSFDNGVSNTINIDGIDGVYLLEVNTASGMSSVYRVVKN